MSTGFAEEILAIERPGAEPLMGILALPAVPATQTRHALIVVVGGPQYRVGSHRQFTLLARRLAAEGVPVLRFDYTGMGDSGGGQLPFTETGDDIRAAIDALHRHLAGLQGVSLWGLCDGASAALLYLDASPDTRVKGLCLLNPWVRSEQSFARTQIKHYYVSRLKQAEFWKKLFSGKVALKALSETASHLRASFAAKGGKRESLSYQQRMARAWMGFPGSILLVLSGQDMVAKEFEDHVASGTGWDGAFRRADLDIHSLPEADHTCSSEATRKKVEALTLAWQQNLARS